MNDEEETQSEERERLTVVLDQRSCGFCGGITVPAGACHRCLNCGETTGCG